MKRRRTRNLANRPVFRKFVYYLNDFPEGDSENLSSFAIQVSKFSDFSEIAPDYLYYKVNACKVEYYPHQMRSIANPIPSYSTFTPANISTSQPPIVSYWSSSEQTQASDDVFKQPRARYHVQGITFKEYRKLSTPVIVAAQGEGSTVNVLMRRAKPLVSTDERSMIWGRHYRYIQDVDQDALDNNDRQPMSCTWRYTIYVSFYKPRL